MTAGASLPPAGVQRPAPPLTEEELAEMGKGHTNMGTPFGTPNICRRCQHYWPCPTERLIAEVARLQAQNAEYVAFIANVVRVPYAP